MLLISRLPIFPTLTIMITFAYRQSPIVLAIRFAQKTPACLLSLRQFADTLAAKGVVESFALDDGIPTFTLADNGLAKTPRISVPLGFWVVADDSGLRVLSDANFNAVFTFGKHI